ncbi:hypothetical protein [Pedobacter sp.]
MENNKKNQNEKNSETSEQAMGKSTSDKQNKTKKNEYTAQENKFADGKGSNLAEAFNKDSGTDQ